MKNNVIFGMGIFHTANRLKVLGQAKINVRQMSRGDSFGCVIFKILWDNGAKTQPRQNTVYVPFILSEGISKSIFINSILNFALLSVFKVRNVIIWHWIGGRGSDQFTASEKFASPLGPPQYSEHWPPQYSKPSYAYGMLFYLNPDFKSRNKQFKRIDFSTNKIGTNHFSLFSSILKPSTLKLSCSNSSIMIVSSMSKLCSSYFLSNIT